LGFIGSHFSRAVASEDVKVIILDKFTYASNILNIDDFKSELLGIENGDIASVEDLTHVFTKYNNIETVINFAAESHVDRSITDSSPFIQSNIVGVSNLLEFLRKGRFNKFIQISTDEVYGSILNGSWDESSALEPRSPYSASKASADMLCEAYRITHSLDISITRCANNYGTHQSVDKLIPKIITFAAKNKKIPVYGDGSNIREWLHVSDHVSAIMNVFHGQKVGGRSVYNIAGNPMTNLDLVQKILDLMDKDESLIEFVSDRKGHDLRYSVNDASIKSKYGWSPKVSLERGIIETIEWYASNTSWVEKSELKVSQ
jgi:dTDP-glucose 4,6-dehydratase